VLALGLAGIAYWQRGIAVEQRDTALLAQSRFLANLAHQAGLAGDQVTEMLLVILALTDETGNRPRVSGRPYSVEAERSLYEGHLGRRELIVLKGFDVFENMFEGIEDVQFSRDDRYVVATVVGTPQFWDTTSGRQIVGADTQRIKEDLQRPRTPPAGVLDRFRWSWKKDDSEGRVSISPAGVRVVTIDDYEKMRVWDAVTGRQIIEISGRPSRVNQGLLAHLNGAAISPDGTRVLTSGEGHVRLFSATNPPKLLAEFEGDDYVRFSPNGDRLLTFARHGPIRLWDAALGAEGAKQESIPNSIVVNGLTYKNRTIDRPENLGIMKTEDGGRTTRTTNEIPIKDAHTDAMVAVLEFSRTGVGSWKGAIWVGERTLVVIGMDGWWYDSILAFLPDHRSTR
jgi:WD40 repeat protein